MGLIHQTRGFMIISLSGYSGSGKSTVGSLLQQRGFKVFSFASAIRRHVAKKWLYGDKKLCETDLRKIIRYVNQTSHVEPDKEWEKTSGFHEELITPDTMRSMDCFVQSLEQITMYTKAGFDLVITDTRFPREWCALRDLGAKMVIVERRERSRPIQPFDRLLNEFEFDFVIDNNGGVELLHKEIDQFFKEFSVNI